MKIINNLLYLEFSEMIECGVSESALKKASYRQSPSWHFINDPKDKRRVLIGYEELKPNYKKLIQERFGNPYNYMAKMPIKKLVALDYKAEEFFKAYRYDGDKFLPIEHVKKYTTVASWLNMLIKLNADKKYIKKELNLSVELFWKNVCEMIQTDNIDLPTTYQRLRNRMSEYQEKSYACLIDWRFGNKLSAKMGKTENGFDADLMQTQVALIRAAASKHQNFDAMQITRAVNKIFQLQQWPTVSHGTVYNIIKSQSHLTTAGSRGKREWDNKMSMHVKRSRPQFPLQHLTLDGWTVELLFQEGDTYHKRLVVVIVLDTTNNYPIGYAIGERESTDLIKQANRNAAYHIKDLFGDHYQPRQIQSDNFGLKTLTPFLQSMAHLHTPAAVGNAKAKVIEPYFKYLNKQYCQVFPNWSGFNVDAKKSNQPNREYLDKIKHSFPRKDEVIKQINMIIAQERKIKIQEYMDRWQLLPESEKLLMSKEDLIMVHGIPTGYTNMITGSGLQPTINGQKLVYDSFDPRFRAMQHLNWQVVYNPDDLSDILVISEDDKHRFVLQQKHLVPMDVHSMSKEDHQHLSEIRNFNKDRHEEIMQTYINDAAIVEEIMNNTPLQLNDFDEAAIKLMFTVNGQQKERLQDAKGLKQVQKQEQKLLQKEHRHAEHEFEMQRQSFIESETDLSKYLND